MLHYAFVERWHEDTYSFHLQIMGEMIVTLDEVSCLLHIPIEGTFLNHNGLVTRTEAVDMMVQLLGLMWT